MLFILSANGPASCSMSDHAAAKASYVTRLRSSASLANSMSLWSLASSSFQYGLLQPPSSISPTPPGSCMTPSTVTYSAATILPMEASMLYLYAGPADPARTADQQARRAGTAPQGSWRARRAACLDAVLYRD